MHCYCFAHLGENFAFIVMHTLQSLTKLFGHFAMGENFDRKSLTRTILSPSPHYQCCLQRESLLNRQSFQRTSE